MGFFRNQIQSHLLPEYHQNEYLEWNSTGQNVWWKDQWERKWGRWRTSAGKSRHCTQKKWKFAKIPTLAEITSYQGNKLLCLFLFLKCTVQTPLFLFPWISMKGKNISIWHLPNIQILTQVFESQNFLFCSFWLLCKATVGYWCVWNQWHRGVLEKRHRTVMHGLPS